MVSMSSLADYAPNLCAVRKYTSFRERTMENTSAETRDTLKPLTVTLADESSASTERKKNTSQAAKARKRWARKTRKERSKIMSEIAIHRWNGVSQSDDKIREFFESAKLDDAFESYAVLRKQYEIAGKILDTRVQEAHNVEKCEYCGKRLDKDIPWFNRDPVKDPATGIIRNIFACSQACMIAMKGKTRKRA
jgi:hypothetical protein